MTAPACPTCAALRAQLAAAEERNHELGNQVMRMAALELDLREARRLLARLQAASR